MKIVDKRKCAKQTTVAIIITDDNDYFVGSNWCENPQDICPRKDMKTGEGYEWCENLCGLTHAEVDACKKAGSKANGATLFLIGHYYCCDNCKIVMNEYGIAKINIIG